MNFLSALQNEIEEQKVFAGDISAEKLKQCKYLDAFYKETLRMATHSLTISRYAEDEITTGTTQISKNTTVSFNIGKGNLDHRAWKIPTESFLPDRFITEDKKIHLHQYPFMPFSAGKRSCPGFIVAEDVFKAAIATLIHYYNVEQIYTLTQTIEISPRYAHKKKKLQPFYI